MITSFMITLREGLNPSLLEVLSYVGYYVLTYVFYRNIVKSEYTEIATPFKPVAE
jgi:branched-subunit amino acid transport protein